MAPKHRVTKDATPSMAATSQTGTTAAGSTPSQPKAFGKAASQGQNWDQVLMNIYRHYLKSTPQRTMLIDSFMAFLVVVGAIQFLYCVLAGNFVCPARPRLVGKAVVVNLSFSLSMLFSRAFLLRWDNLFSRVCCRPRRPRPRRSSLTAT
jgi:DAD family